MAIKRTQVCNQRGIHPDKHPLTDILSLTLTTGELEVIRSNSFGTSRVLTPRTGHSHQSPMLRQTFDFNEITVTEDIKTQRKLLSKPKAEPPTHSFKDSVSEWSA